MAKVVVVTQYEANDGSLFLTEAECDAHEFLLANKVEIEAAAEAFANTVGAIDRSRSIKVNGATEFLAFYIPWVEAGKPVVERTKFDTPKEVPAVAGEGQGDAGQGTDTETKEPEVATDPVF